jgi:hypothetical protein
LFDLFHQQLCDLVDFVIDPKAKETGIAGASERQQYAVMTIKYIDRPTTYSGILQDNLEAHWLKPAFWYKETP